MRSGRTLYEYHDRKNPRFSLIEFFIYETCLLSFGLWLGTCFSKFFKKFRAIIFAAFAATWLYLLWRVFFDEDED